MFLLVLCRSCAASLIEYGIDWATTDWVTTDWATTVRMRQVANTRLIIVKRP